MSGKANKNMFTEAKGIYQRSTEKSRIFSDGQELCDESGMVVNIGHFSF
jgi:hypothetical protein